MLHAVVPQLARWVLAVAAAATILLASGAAIGRTRAVRSRLAVALVAAAPLLNGAVALAAVTAAIAQVWWLVAIGAAVTVALTCSQVTMWVPRKEPREGGRQTLTVMSSNLLFGRARPEAVVAAVNAHEADVLATQELTTDAVSALRAAGLDRLLPHAIVRPRDDPGGAGLWCRWPLSSLEVPGGFAYPPVAARACVGEEVQVTIVCVHPSAPWPSETGAWRRELALLGDWLRTLTGPVVVAGDFNATRDHLQFRRLLGGNVVDAMEDLGGGFRPTYPSTRAMPPVIAIDHVLTMGGVRAERATTLKVPKTDHRALVVQLALPDGPEVSSRR